MNVRAELASFFSRIYSRILERVHLRYGMQISTIRQCAACQYDNTQLSSLR